MAITIRRATADDLDTLVRLRMRFLAGVRQVPEASFNEAFRAHTREYCETTLADGRCVTWLADAGEGIAGCCAVTLMPVPPRTEPPRTYDGLVLTVWVEPEWRSDGVGRQLMEALLGAREELSIDRLFLHATRMGRPLYESIGFHVDEALLQLDPDDGPS